MIGKAKPDTWYRDSYTNLWKYIQSDGTVFDGPKLVVNGTTYYFAMLGKGGAMGFDGLAENCVWYDNETGILIGQTPLVLVLIQKMAGRKVQMANLVMLKMEK